MCFVGCSRRDDSEVDGFLKGFGGGFVVKFVENQDSEGSSTGMPLTECREEGYLGTTFALVVHQSAPK